ncbi:BMP-binding endothelial regulator protein-like [Dreissena polymorpha]|nr:BMP-binding endothelial regulator protein-like [Dreissena polymorpha]
MAKLRRLLVICVICLIGVDASCTYGSRTYKEGERVPSKDVCLICTCSNGKIVCDRMYCLMCVGYTPPGQCCPICGSIAE